MSDSIHIPPPPPPPVTPPSGQLGWNDPTAKPIPHANKMKCKTNFTNNIRDYLRYNRNRDVETCFAYFKELLPHAQDGPQCGLVALAIASQHLCKHPLGVTGVHKRAVELKYTKQGEMFSVSSMASLCEELIGCSATAVHGDHIKSGFLEALFEGNLILVPYDCDHNHVPCNKGGTKAHWAIVIGFIVQVSKDNMVAKASEFITKDQEISTLYLINDCSFLNTIKDEIDLSSIQVIALHGKSLRAQIWSLESLLESNGQLEKLSNEISQNLSDYVIPPEGIKGGLCSQIIILSNKL